MSYFTEEQKEYICRHIDAWYMYYRPQLNNCAFPLGYLKEKLKNRICGYAETDEMIIFPECKKEEEK